MENHMVSFSPTVIVGNLTRDPELNYTDSGVARLNFSIASNHYYKDAQGEKQEKTSFFNCTAWRYTAEDAADVLEKGIGVIVQGRLEQRSWEDKEGNKRSSVDLIVDHVGILCRSIESLERKQRSQDGAQGGASSPRASKARQPAMAGAEEEPF